MYDPHDYTSFELVDLLSEFNFSKRSYEMVNRIEKEKKKKEEAWDIPNKTTCSFCGLGNG